MNPFFAHRTPSKTALSIKDKDVSKMLIEIAQALSNVIRAKRGHVGVLAWDTQDEHFGIFPQKGQKWKKYDYTLHGETGQAPLVYLIKNTNHPLTRWASKSFNNYLWLLQLGYFLADRYTQIHNKIHKSLSVLRRCEPHRQVNPRVGLISPLSPDDFPYKFLTKPPQ